MNHLFQPANPTFPIQDKFGNVQVSFGLTKLEYVAALICANANPFGEAPGKELDEIRNHAELCVFFAEMLLNAVQERTIEIAKAAQDKNSQIISGK